MLPEHLEQSFLDLSSINCNTLLFHLLHLFLVELHKLDIRISLDWLHLLVDDLVVGVDAIDVLEETFEHGHWRRYRCIDEQGTAKVGPCLAQIVGAEVILRELSNVVTTERRFNSVYRWMRPELVEKSHACRGLL